MGAGKGYRRLTHRIVGSRTWTHNLLFPSLALYWLSYPDTSTCFIFVNNETTHKTAPSSKQYKQYAQISHPMVELYWLERDHMILCRFFEEAFSEVSLPGFEPRTFRSRGMSSTIAPFRRLCCMLFLVTNESANNTAPSSRDKQIAQYHTIAHFDQFE